MATMLENCTVEEQYSDVFFFLWAKGQSAKNIHKEIFSVYGGKYLSLKVVHNWVYKLSQGRSNVTDDARQGLPVVIASDANVQQVEGLIRADRRITKEGVATALGSSHGLAYSIMHDHLKLRKVCTRWVPRDLKDREKMNRMSLSLLHFLRYADKGEDSSMLNWIVTGDESWVHHYQPSNTNQSVLQCNGNIPVHLQPRSSKFKLHHQLGRLCVARFEILREYCSPFSEKW
jgi:hypothetical protein